MYAKLIPKNGGYQTNTLPISRKFCVVYDRQTLQILRVAETHNKAEQMANDLFVNKGIDARADMIEFHDDTVNALNLPLMKLNQFACFVESNNHPLNPIPIQVITESDQVDTLFENADGDLLPEYAERDAEYAHVLDFCFVADDTFIGGVALEMGVYDDAFEIDLKCIHIEPHLRGEGYGTTLIDEAVKKVKSATDVPPASIRLFCDIVSDGGQALVDKFEHYLGCAYPNAELRVIDEALNALTR